MKVDIKSSQVKPYSELSSGDCFRIERCSGVYIKTAHSDKACRLQDGAISYMNDETEVVPLHNLKVVEE